MDIETKKKLISYKKAVILSIFYSGLLNKNEKLLKIFCFKNRDMQKAL